MKNRTAEAIEQFCSAVVRAVATQNSGEVNALQKALAELREALGEEDITDE